MTGPESFCILNRENRVAAAHDWNRPEVSRLWRYHLHYFDDLTADDAQKRKTWHRSLIERWIAGNPAGQGTGWESYPTSLRIVNWIQWALGGNELSTAALHSLAVQVRWLAKRLEHHLLGNHLLANAKALVFAGAFFQGSEAERWRRRGVALLLRELDEQILDDGGHFERSPMYHAIVFKDVLDLVQLGRIFPGVFHEDIETALHGRVAPMLYWLRVMTHPDGEISFFNDAAFGMAPAPAALRAYAQILEVAKHNTKLESLEVLESSGYVRLAAGPAVLIADVGQIGPDYLPGHAHADTLSFELSLHGQRVLVNGGTSTYEPGPERLAQRATAAHNTVVVDGEDSSEVWGSFRVARRARPMNVSWGSDDRGLWLRAGHNGYRRLPGRVDHYREWALGASELRVNDTLEGDYLNAVARFRFYPDFDVFNDGRVEGVVKDLYWMATSTGAAVRYEQWHPRFGESRPCRVLDVPVRDRLSIAFHWG